MVATSPIDASDIAKLRMMSGVHKWKIVMS